MMVRVGTEMDWEVGQDPPFLNICNTNIKKGVARESTGQLRGHSRPRDTKGQKRQKAADDIRINTKLRCMI